jgi:hypothetical protein
MNKPLQVVCILATVCVMPLWAQDPAYPVWRCGHEFTNQPRPGENCQQVDLPAEITMTAPRKRPNFDKSNQTPPILVMPHIDISNQAPQIIGMPPLGPSSPPPSLMLMPSIDRNAQRQRDARAKSILNDELLKTQTRCQQLPVNSTELVRCRADEAALRRELARAP